MTIGSHRLWVFGTRKALSLSDGQAALARRFGASRNVKSSQSDSRTVRGVGQTRVSDFTGAGGAATDGRLAEGKRMGPLPG